MKYCITHECEAGENYESFPSLGCLIVNSAPPELPDNWIEFVQDPYLEELEVMDRNALMLMEDLGVS